MLIRFSIVLNGFKYMFNVFEFPKQLERAVRGSSVDVKELIGESRRFVLTICRPDWFRLLSMSCCLNVFLVVRRIVLTMCRPVTGSPVPMGSSACLFAEMFFLT